MENKAIFKFHFDCGRMGELEGLFISTKEKVNALIESGVEVYFGEVLGKHSEIYGPIEEDDITLVSESLEAVNVISELKLETGYNPFDYTTSEGIDVSEAIEEYLTEKK